MKRSPEVQRHIYPQFWLLVVAMTALGLLIAYDLHYVEAVLEADRSRISILILAIFVGATGHAAWHIFLTSRRIEAAEAVLRGDAPGPSPDERALAAATPLDYVRGFIADSSASSLAAAKTTQPEQGQSALVLEIYADQLRSAVETGWFIVDILIRMGLIGTIVGFIMILGTLADGAEVTPDNIQTLLISMSGGMGTALYTTLAGLATATLLAPQYIILGRSVERLVAQLVRVRGVGQRLERSP